MADPTDSPAPDPRVPVVMPPVVLQVLPALDSGGVERHVLTLAAAVAGAGGVSIVASSGGRLVPTVERAGRHLALPLERRGPLAIRANARRLEAAIREHGVNLVHAHSRAPAWAAWLAARRTGVPLVTTYHGTYSEGLPGKRLYNSVMARGARVIAPSRFVAGMVSARHATPPERLRVVPHGVDTRIFDPEVVVPDRLVRMAAGWRVPDGAPTILLPGRLTRWKGQAVLIKALARMQRRDAVVLLTGDARRQGYAKELAALAETLGLGERVRMVGHIEDMPAALMLSDVVVNASTDPEAFGLVIAEALAMERPVIASDHGAARETVAQGETGWRVPPGDETALAARLDAVLAMTQAQRQAIGRAARAFVLAHHDLARMQEATLDVYEELLEAR